MRQLGLFIQMYATEHRNTYPTAFGFDGRTDASGQARNYSSAWWMQPAGDDGHWTWYDAIASRNMTSEGGLRVFVCPTDTPQTNNNPALWYSYMINSAMTWTGSPTIPRVLWGVTGYHSNNGQDFPASVYGKTTQVGNASETILLAESSAIISGGHTGFSRRSYQGNLLQGLGNAQDSVIFRHGGANSQRIGGRSSSNLLMCDGSVQQIQNLLETVGTGTVVNPRGQWTRASND